MISFRESHVFTVISSVLGCSINFKIKQKFLLKRPVSPDYLSVSCDYDETENQNLNIFLILYSVNDYIIGLFSRAIEVEYFGACVTYKIPTDEVRNLLKVFNDLEKGTVFVGMDLLFLFIYLFVYLFIYLFIHLFIFLIIYQPVLFFFVFYNHSHWFLDLLKYLLLIIFRRNRNGKLVLNGLMNFFLVEC